MSKKLIGVSLLVPLDTEIPRALLRKDYVTYTPLSKDDPKQGLVIRIPGAKSCIKRNVFQVMLNHGSNEKVSFPLDQVIKHGCLKGPKNTTRQTRDERTCRVCRCETGVPLWNVLAKTPTVRKYECPDCGRSWVCTGKY